MHLPPKSTAAKGTPVSLWEHLLCIQVFHWCRIYQADSRDLIHSLYSCTERFPFLFLSHTAPGVQLCFWPHPCMCVTLSCLFHIQVRRSESSIWLGHTYSLGLGRGIAATAGVCANCLWQRRPAGSCNRLGHARSGGNPSQYPQRQGLACGCSGGYPPYMPLNNGASFPR